MNIISGVHNTFSNVSEEKKGLFPAQAGLEKETQRNHAKKKNLTN